MLFLCRGTQLVHACILRHEEFICNFSDSYLDECSKSRNSEVSWKYFGMCVFELQYFR